MVFRILVLAVLFFSLEAGASGVVCGSADGKLKYSYHRPDGGAPSGPSEELSVDTETYISIPPRGGPAIDRATFKMVGPQKKVATKKADQMTKLTYVQRMTVILTKDTPYLFDGLVLCEQSTYTGPPRP